MGTAEYSLTVPLPGKALSPNARAHWGTKARDKQAAKQHAYVAALVVIGPADVPVFERAILDVVWYGRTAKVRAMDDDNAWATLKSTRDGLSRAGFVADDNHFRQGTLRIEVDKKNPRVEITVRAMENL